jgi:membrane fusion protein, multidrug efflux system
MFTFNHLCICQRCGTNDARKDCMKKIRVGNMNAILNEDGVLEVGWSPESETITAQPVPNLPMKTDHNSDLAKRTKSMDRFEATTTDGLTETVSPNHELGAGSQVRTRVDGDGNPTNRAVSGRSGAKRRIALSVVGVAAGVVAAIYYLLFIAPFESTDDAFIDGHVTQIAPQVAGRVARVLVSDNQFVNAGDVLVQIEPSNYEAKLEQERANLASAQSRLGQANAQLAVDQAKVEQENANVIAAHAEATRADADSKRYEEIGTSGVSQSQIDLAATQARSTAANLTAARSKELAAEAQAGLDQASIQTAEAEIKTSEAAVREAELNLSYTQIKAHEAGYVTHRTVENDSYAEPGQALLAIVPENVWVVANFKETQLTHMRPGQRVTVHVDAYPKIKFVGHLDSIQSGSGARFSLFPPENATGNYVKVVQSVPVKIVFDNNFGADVVLGPGMSVEPKVRIR